MTVLQAQQWKWPGYKAYGPRYMPECPENRNWFISTLMFITIQRENSYN